ncbi:MAG: isoprenylcysteine carboxylmethyltransferase family protein [Pseudomonadota bacterium]
MHIPPPLIAFAIGAAMKAAVWTNPAWTWETPARFPIAVGLVIAGAGIAAVGVLQFRRNRTTINPLQPDKASTLVTDGIYRVTRNPMYLGLLCFLLAWGIWLGSPLAILIALVFIPILNRSQILPEERALRQRFGEKFSAYVATTRRWL